MVEPAEVWKRATVRAQVRHPCVGCGMFVCVGTVHERIDSLLDGDWATWRVHLECLELAISMQDADDRTYDVHDVHGQLHDRGDDLRPWRELLDARRREQEGRADLCAWGLGRANHLTAWQCDAVAVPGEFVGTGTATVRASARACRTCAIEVEDVRGLVPYLTRAERVLSGSSVDVFGPADARRDFVEVCDAVG